MTDKKNTEFISKFAWPGVCDACKARITYSTELGSDGNELRIKTALNVVSFNSKYPGSIKSRWAKHAMLQSDLPCCGTRISDLLKKSEREIFAAGYEEPKGLKAPEAQPTPNPLLKPQEQQKPDEKSEVVIA